MEEAGSLCQRAAHLSGPRPDNLKEVTQPKFRDLWAQPLDPANEVGQKISDNVDKMQLSPVPFRIMAELIF